MSKCLVTGADDFIGNYMANKLFDEGHFVRAVDEKWESFPDSVFYSEKITADLTDEEECRKVTEGIEEIYHFASQSNIYSSGIRIEKMKKDMLMNFNILQASIDNNIKRIFFPSSCLVYFSEKITDEESNQKNEEGRTILKPSNISGWEKLFTENILSEACRIHGIDIKLARLGNIYGPYCNFKGSDVCVIMFLCRKVAETPSSGTIKIPYPGDSESSFCYVSDCVEGIYGLMQSDCNFPVNICSSETIDVDSLMDIIIEISGKEIEKDYETDVKYSLRRMNFNNTRMKEITGWEPQVDLEEGLRRTYPWVVEKILEMEINKSDFNV